MIETLSESDKVVAIQTEFKYWLANTMKTLPWKKRSQYYRSKLTSIFCLQETHSTDTLRWFLTEVANIEADYECIDVILLQLLKHKISFISFENEILQLIHARDYSRNLHVIDQFLKEDINWDASAVRLGKAYELYLARKRDDFDFVLATIKKNERWNAHPYAEVFESLAYLVRKGIDIENYEL